MEAIHSRVSPYYTRLFFFLFHTHGEIGGFFFFKEGVCLCYSCYTYILTTVSYFLYSFGLSCTYIYLYKHTWNKFQKLYQNIINSIIFPETKLTHYDIPIKLAFELNLHSLSIVGNFLLAERGVLAGMIRITQNYNQFTQNGY